jgi:NAD dependent epimerase/dehydratase family enzyme
VLGSRVDGTTTLARAMAQAVATGQGPKVLLSSSAIGWYGDTGDRLTDETGPTGEGFLAEVCRQWEASTAEAEQAGVRVAHLRTGDRPVGRAASSASKLLLFKAGLGAPLGSGKQWTSWISLQDEVSAIRHLLSRRTSRAPSTSSALRR